MKLWIRSQNKSLLKQVSDLKVKEVENRTYKYGDIGKSNEFAIVSNDIILGCYETKERALEVLDEIQKKINLINLGRDFNSPMIDLNNLTYIYEMPKE